MTSEKEAPLKEALDSGRTPWILTYSGSQFVYDYESKITIEDVAHSLARIVRFTGHVKTWYSVAEHSLRVCELAMVLSEKESDDERARIAKWALLHDAAEAYIGDINSPLKKWLRRHTNALEELEARIMDQVRVQLELEGDAPAIVKQCDMILCATEARDLMPDAHTGWLATLPEPLPRTIIPMPVHHAEHAFLTAYARLSEGQFARRIIVPGQ